MFYAPVRFHFCRVSEWIAYHDFVRNGCPGLFRLLHSCWRRDHHWTASSYVLSIVAGIASVLLDQFYDILHPQANIFTHCVHRCSFNLLELGARLLFCRLLSQVTNLLLLRLVQIPPWLTRKILALLAHPRMWVASNTSYIANGILYSKYHVLRNFPLGMGAGVVNVAATFVSIATVDKAGRKVCAFDLECVASNFLLTFLVNDAA